jgi:hypothetical protein
MSFVNQLQRFYVTFFAGDTQSVWEGVGAIVDCSPAQHAGCTEKKGRYLHLPIQVKAATPFSEPTSLCCRTSECAHMVGGYWTGLASLDEAKVLLISHSIGQKLIIIPRY